MSDSGEYIKNVFLAGVGIFSLTKDTIEDIVDKLVSSGQVDESEAGVLAKQLAERAEAQRKELEQLIREQIQIAVRNTGVITTSELDKVSKRIEAIEKLLD